MNRLLFIALFIFLNACSFNIDSKYWNEKSDKKKDEKKKKKKKVLKFVLISLSNKN